MTARRQVEFWENTVNLFEHAVAVTTDNSPAQYSLGIGLERGGQTNTAMAQYRVAVAMNPRDTQARGNLAHLLREKGEWAEAADQYSAILRVNPRDLPAELNLAQSLSQLGRAGEAVFHLETALQIDPNSTEALNNLAWMLATSPDDGIRNGARAVQLSQHACELTGYKKPFSSAHWPPPKRRPDNLTTRWRRRKRPLHSRRQTANRICSTKTGNCWKYTGSTRRIGRLQEVLSTLQSECSFDS